MQQPKHHALSQLLVAKALVSANLVRPSRLHAAAAADLCSHAAAATLPQQHCLCALHCELARQFSALRTCSAVLPAANAAQSFECLSLAAVLACAAPRCSLQLAQERLRSAPYAYRCLSAPLMKMFYNMPLFYVTAGIAGL